MQKIRGLPGKRQLWAALIGAAILPAALAGSGEVAVWTACIYWLVSVAAVTFGSVTLAYLVSKGRPTDDGPHSAL